MTPVSEPRTASENRRPEASTEAFTVGDWQVFPDEGVLRRDGSEVHLTLQQMKLLQYLVSHRDRVVAKEEIFESVWQGAEVEDVGLPRCVSEIRSALGDDAREPRYIRTFPKRGYRLIAPVLEGPRPASPVIGEPDEATPDAATEAVPRRRGRSAVAIFALLAATVI